MLFKILGGPDVATVFSQTIWMISFFFIGILNKKEVKLIDFNCLKGDISSLHFTKIKMQKLWELRTALCCRICGHVDTINRISFLGKVIIIPILWSRNHSNLALLAFVDLWFIFYIFFYSKKRLSWACTMDCPNILNSHVDLLVCE